MNTKKISFLFSAAMLVVMMTTSGCNATQQQLGGGAVAGKGHAKEAAHVKKCAAPRTKVRVLDTHYRSIADRYSGVNPGAILLTYLQDSNCFKLVASSAAAEAFRESGRATTKTPIDLVIELQPVHSDSNTGGVSAGGIGGGWIGVATGIVGSLRGKEAGVNIVYTRSDMTQRVAYGSASKYDIDVGALAGGISRHGFGIGGIGFSQSTDQAKMLASAVLDAVNVMATEFGAQ